MLPSSPVPGTILGPYRIVAPLGRGGMGTVCRARDERTGREVALKVLSPELATDPDARVRFEREARAASAVVHPNVARVLDVGPDGAYVAFELLPGGSLAERLDARGSLPWSEVARLGTGIARGLAAVHERGIVHRDLKPANVLLDAAGEPKIADFGLARQRDARSLEALTRTGEVVGTLEFLAPEQADGTRAVDSRADLYGLGATLHALLTGAPPFRGSGYALLRKHLVERPPSSRSLAPDTPEPLSALVLGLMSKDPAARGDAATVALELERIEREGGAATRPRRLPLVALALAASAAVLTLGVVTLGPRGAAPAASLPADAPQPLRPAGPAHVAEPAFVSSGLEGAVGDCRATVTTRLRDAWGNRAFRTGQNVTNVAVSPDGRQVLVATRERGTWLLDRRSGDLLRWADDGRAAAFVPGGRLAITSVRPASARVRELASGRTVRTLEGHAKEVVAVSVSADGARALTGATDGTARLWDLGTGTCLATLRSAAAEVWTVAILPGERRAVTGGLGGVLELWELPSGTKLADLAGHRGCVNALAAVDATRVLAAGSEDPAALVWDVERREATRTLAHGEWTRAIAGSPDGTRAVLAGADGRMEVHVLAPGAEAATLGTAPGLLRELRAAAFAPDGRSVLLGDAEGFVLEIDVTGDEPRPIARPGLGHESAVAAVGFGRGKDEAVSLGFDGRAVAWGRGSPRVGVAVDGFDAADVSLDGSRALVSKGRSLTVLDLRPDAPEPKVHVGIPCRAVRLLEGGRSALLLSRDGRGELRHWDGRALSTWLDKRESRAVVLCLSRSARHAAVGYEDGTVALVDVRGRGRPAGTWTVPGGVSALALSADGKRLLAGGPGGELTLWTTADRRLTRTFPRAGGETTALAFLPGDRALASTVGEPIRLLDLATGAEVDRIPLGADWAQCTAVSDDGRSLLVGTGRGLVLRFDLLP